uniref:Secreted protein n=1 Tax=Steinernema glaseri TaxID=37863 RepID=A0A1I8AT11_9BILA
MLHVWCVMLVNCVLSLILAILDPEQVVIINVYVRIQRSLAKKRSTDGNDRNKIPCCAFVMQGNYAGWDELSRVAPMLKKKTNDKAIGSSYCTPYDERNIMSQLLPISARAPIRSNLFLEAAVVALWRMRLVENYPLVKVSSLDGASSLLLGEMHSFYSVEGGLPLAFAVRVFEPSKCSELDRCATP